jgi:glycolate oxidase FAD binding subunit
MGMSEMATRLSEALPGNGALQLWDAVDAQQQQAIMSAIASSDSLPACLALPSTPSELARVMAIACAHNWRVLPMGQGSKLSWGGLAEGVDIVVSTARLNRVVEHAVGDFTVTVEPGLKVAELRQILAEQRQFLAVDPAFEAQATVGGLVATADTGSLRQRYGGLRDMLIGLSFVRYDGEIARAGGRVVKNVAGYDLMKLLTGSYGSLGILSELTFRLSPLPPYSRSLILNGPSQAIEAATAEVRLSGLTPVALDVLSASLAETLEASAALSLVARFQGIEAGVEEQTARLKQIATTHSMGFVQLDGAADEDFWRRSEQVLKGDRLLCKVGLRPSGIPWLIELADKVMPGAQVRLYGSSGLGWVQFDATGASEKSVVSGIEELRSHCQKNAGFLTLLQASKAIKQAVDVWGYSGNALSVMSDIKQNFDPQRQFSPGRFVGQL